MAPFVYCNGSYFPADGPVLAPTDRGFLLGEGLYETVRVVAKRPLAIDLHYARLARNLETLGIPPCVDPLALNAAIAGLLERNGLDDARLRLNVSAGPAGGPPTVMILAMPYEGPTAEQFGAGVAVVSSRVPHPRMSVKTLSHLAYVMVDREARAAGAYEGVFLEGEHWVEGSRTNLIARQGRRLVIPDSPWALPGVTLANVLKGVESAGWEVTYRAFGPADLGEFDGVYISNAIIEVVPVATLDSKPLASAGPEAVELRNCYRRAIGLPAV